LFTKNSESHRFDPDPRDFERDELLELDFEWPSLFAVTVSPDEDESRPDSGEGAF
jgi:hypothetical protein